MTHPTDYSKHTDEQLRDGIARVDEQASRIATEDSDEALRAAQEQRAAMAAELDRRQQQSQQ